jgi:hypothetical protein
MLRLAPLPSFGRHAPTRAGLVVLGLALGAPACTAPAQGPGVATSGTKAPAPARITSGTPLERFLPLHEGHRYLYEFETSDGARGLLPVVHRRVDATHGSWQLSGGGNDFEYVADGVLTFGSGGATHLLKAPLTPGTTWRGGNQSTVAVQRIEVALTVPAGRFEGCVETSETRGGDAPLAIVAVYCPEVGMVERSIASGGRKERLVLKSYGPPIDLGPDGVRILKDE